MWHAPSSVIWIVRRGKTSCRKLRMLTANLLAWGCTKMLHFTTSNPWFYPQPVARKEQVTIIMILLVWCSGRSTLIVLYISRTVCTQTEWPLQKTGHQMLLSKYIEDLYLMYVYLIHFITSPSACPAWNLMILDTGEGSTFWTIWYLEGITSVGLVYRAYACYWGPKQAGMNWSNISLVPVPAWVGTSGDTNLVPLLYYFQYTCPILIENQSLNNTRIKLVGKF